MDTNKLIVPVVAAVVVIGAAAWLTLGGGLAKLKMMFIAPAAGGSTGSTGSTSGGSSAGSGGAPPGNSGNPSGAALNVAVTATDASDISVRSWSIWTANPGSYAGSGNYSSGSPVASGFYPSGSTANFNVSGNPSTLWLTITQSGGSGYGTYAGTITVNGKAIPFQGVDANHPFQFQP